MADRVSKTEAKHMQRDYRDAHTECWRPIKVNGLWRFCRRKPAVCDHIPRKVGGWERPEVYYSLCQGFRSDCHNAWKHDGNRQGEPEGYRMLQQFAIKEIMGEGDLANVPRYMKGRTWWRHENEQDLATDIEGMVDLMIQEFKDLIKTELPRWQRGI